MNPTNLAGGVVCLCNSSRLAPALHCAMKLAMCCCIPFRPVSDADPDLCYSIEHIDDAAGLLEDHGKPLSGSPPPISKQHAENCKTLYEHYFQPCFVAKNITLPPHDCDSEHDMNFAHRNL